MVDAAAAGCPLCRSGIPTASTSADAPVANANAAAIASGMAAEPAFASLHCWTRYEGVGRTLVRLLKYEGVTPVAGFLAARLAAQPLPRADLVIPVPLGARRQRERGYNQAEELARRLARRCGLPCHALLRRRRETLSQTGLTRPQRAENVAHAFTALGAAPLRGRVVLLVDDVLTTGATAAACSLALRRAGARAVHVVTVTRAELRSATEFANANLITQELN